MLFCNKPFEQLYISENYVKTCPWTNLILGNPTENSIEDLWTNENAEKIRESIKDGSFRFCRKEECPWCASGQLEEMDEDDVRNYDACEYPMDINVSYDRVCNHSCPSCRKSVFIPDDAYKEKMGILKEVVLPIANKAKRMSTCGMGDCFSSPFIMELLRELKPEDPEFSISFETNGVLLDEKHWNAISNIHSFPINVTITPNSFDRYTYMYLSGGHDDVEISKRNLRFVHELRESGKITSFKINMVVQESNYWEIPSFVSKCLEKYNPDIIQIKPLNRWFCVNSADYWFKNVLNPLHPYHENYLKVMQDPILQNPKVFDWTSENHDRLPKLHPAVYNESYTDVYRKLMLQENWKELLKNKLDNMDVKSIAIYGAWSYGELCYELLSQIPDICIKYFIDKYKGSTGNELCCEKPVKGTWQGYTFEEVDLIIISVVSLRQEVENDLRKSGFLGKILSLGELVIDE